MPIISAILTGLILERQHLFVFASFFATLHCHGFDPRVQVHFNQQCCKAWGKSVFLVQGTPLGDKWHYSFRETKSTIIGYFGALGNLKRRDFEYRMICCTLAV